MFDWIRRLFNNRGMPYLTTAEITERFGLSRAWISSLFNRGKIRGTRTKEGLLLIDEQSLQEYLAAPRDKGGRPGKRTYRRG